MKELSSTHKNEAALRRFAAVSFIEQKQREGLALADALRLAALRPWPDEQGDYYAPRTLEDSWYAYKKGGFAALESKGRSDRGAYRALSEEVGQWVLAQVKDHPAIPLKVLYPRWMEAGKKRHRSRLSTASCEVPVTTPLRCGGAGSSMVRPRPSRRLLSMISGWPIFPQAQSFRPMAKPSPRICV
jgi:hypothetical protein